MQEVTAWFVILLIPIILVVDGIVWYWFGQQATITWVVRSYNEKSSWPEILYVVVFVAAYLHLFRKVM